MTRHRAISPARILGHCAWWIFVVATLFAGGITWTGVDRYVPFVPVLHGAGWIDIPSTDAPVAIVDFAGTAYDPGVDPEIVSVVAFVVVLIAATVEAISVRQVLPGMATVAAPCVALGLLLLATPGVLQSVSLDTLATMGIVLIAVAVREVWARRFAPSPSTLPPTSIDTA